MAVKEKLIALIKRKEQYIATKEKQLAREVAVLQSRLFEILLSDLIGDLETENGVILNNKHNLSLVSKVEQSFNSFSSLYHNDVLKSHASDMLKLTSFSATYYEEGLGFAKKEIERIKKSTGFIKDVLGINKNGNIVKGSFLDSLSNVPEVRKQIKQNLLESITTKQPLKQFTKGFKELIVGNSKVEGRLQKYYKQFVFDTSNNVDAIINNHFAQSLNLKHFLYQGTIIKSSRVFCRKRAGQAFHVDDTKTWKDDPDLIDKSTKESYKPLIERGRYNCRHIIAYITKEIAEQEFKYTHQTKEHE